MSVAKVAAGSGSRVDAGCGGSDFDEFCQPLSLSEAPVCWAGAGISALAPIAARSDVSSMMAFGLSYLQKAISAVAAGQEGNPNRTDLETAGLLQSKTPTQKEGQK